MSCVVYNTATCLYKSVQSYIYIPVSFLANSESVASADLCNRLWAQTRLLEAS